MNFEVLLFILSKSFERGRLLRLDKIKHEGNMDWFSFALSNRFEVETKLGKLPSSL